MTVTATTIDQATQKEAFHTAISSLPDIDQTANGNNISQLCGQEEPSAREDESELQARRTRAMMIGRFLHPSRTQSWQSMIDTLPNDDLPTDPATLQSERKPKGRDQAMARISLDHRLSRLTKGNSSDPDYVVQVLKAAVDLKVESAVRLEKQIQEIADTLTISYKEAASMTYGEMSVLIHRMWNMGGENRYRAIEVMFNLAAPFYIENRRRRRKNA